MNIKRRYFALAGAVAVAGGLGLAAPAAHADPAGVPVVQNSAGAAGYSVNDNGATRIRNAQSTVTVTPQLKNLNGSLVTNPGAVGNELCDPNTGYAVQLGVLWDTNETPNAFEVEYGYGTLPASSDPCIQSGLLTGITGHIHFMNAPAIHQGDVIHLDLFFNAQGSFHYTKFAFCDITQNFCRQVKLFLGWHDFYEAGIGAISNANVLTAPAANFLDTFSQLSFNYYSATHGWGSIYVPAHWQLQRDEFINSSSQVVMSSNGSLNGAGTQFTLFEGSTSP